MTGYHAILYLDPEVCARFRESIFFESNQLSKKKFKNIVSDKDRLLTILSKLDSVECYVADLHAAFSEIAMFFWDKYGGDKIAVVWKQSVAGDSEPILWKVNSLANISPCEGMLGGKKKDKPMMKINKLAMLAEMQRLGNGLVTAIQLQ